MVGTWAATGIGVGVILAILILAWALNRRRTAATVAFRMAEVARQCGDHVVALALYDHVASSGHHPPGLADATRLARGGNTAPVLEGAEFDAAMRQWRDHGPLVRRFLRRQGYEGPWPEQEP